MMKANELRDKTTAELEAQLTSLKKDLFFLRMQHATNQNYFTRKGASDRSLRR